MATIKDVARRAGVAPSTVSYVLNGSRSISEGTRRAVREAVAELGYHPRASARTLRSARSDVLALAVPRVPGGYRAVDGRFAVDVSDAARAHGYDVLLLTDLDGVAGLRRVARSGLADAAILMAVEERDARAAAARELGFPTVLLGRGEDDPALPWADLDWEAALALAVHEAVAAGHRSLAFLASADHEFAARRGYALRGLAGARLAAARAGVALRTGESSARPVEMRRRLHALLAPGPAGGPGPAAPTALIVQHLHLLPQLLADPAVSALRTPGGGLAVLPVGTLPDTPGVGDVPHGPDGRPLPRIELPVAEMAGAVARLAAEAVDRAAGRPARGRPPERRADSGGGSERRPRGDRSAGPAAGGDDPGAGPAAGHRTDPAGAGRSSADRPSADRPSADRPSADRPSDARPLPLPVPRAAPSGEHAPPHLLIAPRMAPGAPVPPPAEPH